MRIETDLVKCQGYICCMIAAPEVFDIDDGTSKVRLLVTEPDQALREKVEDAVRCCPAGALRIAAD